MATSKCTWIAFALTFAVAAATLPHPSAATSRVVVPDAAASDQQEASSAPPSSPSWPPMWRPRAPLPPLPCIPGLPHLPWLPPCTNSSSSSSPPSSPPPSSSSAPPPPAECRTSLSGVAAPCAEFLTNASRGVSAAPPAAACCDGLRSLVKDAPICLCHAMMVGRRGGGDLGKLLPAPALRMRVAALPRVCRVAVPFGTLRSCIRGPVPPMDAPSAPPAA